MNRVNVSCFLCFAVSQLSHEPALTELNNLYGLAAILSYPLDIETVELEEQMDKERLAAEEGQLGEQTQ